MLKFKAERADLFYAVETMNFNDYNVNTSSLMMELSNAQCNIYSCITTIANKAVFPVTDLDSVDSDPKTLYIHGKMFVDFIETIPADVINFKSDGTNLFVKGTWEEDGKENYVEQTFQLLQTNFPRVDKLYKQSEKIGEVSSDFLLDGLKFAKGLMSKDTNSGASIGVVDNKLVFMDNVKINVFKPTAQIPRLNFSPSELAPVISYLNNCKNKVLSIRALPDKNGKGGFVLEVPDNSYIIFSADSAPMSINASIEFKDDLPIMFEIDSKKMLTNLNLFKSKLGELFDEMDLNIDPDGYMYTTSQGNMDSKLSIKAHKLPKDNITVKIRYSNLIAVLKALPKSSVMMALNPEDKKLLMKCTDEKNNEIVNILSYWHE